MRGSNAKSKPTTRRKSSSGGAKSKRSNSVSKNSAADNNGAAANQLDGAIDRTESATVENQAGDRILAQAGADSGAPGDAVQQPELTAITLIQPWASLIAKGYKQYETRDWPTNYRGLIAIHAGRKPKSKQELREHNEIIASFDDLLTEDCSYSSIIAIAQMTDCILMTQDFINQQSSTELRCGNWAVGRYAFKLENVRAIEPIPATGKQGLWKWDNTPTVEQKFFKLDTSIKYLDLTNSQFKVGDRIAWCVAGNDLGKVGTVTNISQDLITWFYDGSTVPTSCLVSQCHNLIKKLDEQQLTTANNWNPDDFGELHHKADENGQLSLLEYDCEPPEPDDYESIELFDEAYKIGS